MYLAAACLVTEEGFKVRREKEKYLLSFQFLKAADEADIGFENDNVNTQVLGSIPLENNTMRCNIMKHNNVQYETNSTLQCVQ